MCLTCVQHIWALPCATVVSSEVFSTDVNSVNKNQRDVCHFVVLQDTSKQ